MICIVDYGMGNVRSVEKSFSAVGLKTRLTKDPGKILSASGIILPGVGAFSDAMAALEESGLDKVLIKAAGQGIPLLGICLGMQLLMDASEEMGHKAGLGLIPGQVKAIKTDLKVPHMGWNQLKVCQDHPILAGIEEGAFFYFVHSYQVFCQREADLLAVTDYDGPVAALVGRGSVVGIQFHPEKSSQAGLRILTNFGRMVKAYDGDTCN